VVSGNPHSRDRVPFGGTRSARCMAIQVGYRCRVHQAGQRKNPFGPVVARLSRGPCLYQPLPQFTGPPSASDFPASSRMAIAWSYWQAISPMVQMGSELFTFWMHNSQGLNDGQVKQFRKMLTSILPYLGQHPLGGPGLHGAWPFRWVTGVGSTRLGNTKMGWRHPDSMTVHSDGYETRPAGSTYPGMRSPAC